MLLSIKMPRQEGMILVGASEKDEGLVETDAGYVGGFDVVWCVIVLFREGDGEVLDAVFEPKSFEEDDEVSEVFYEVVIAIVCFDIAQEDYVVGEIEHAFGLRQDDKCCGECRVVRGEADAVTVLLIGHRRGFRSEVVVEIFLYFGECSFQTLV